jgi:predicted small lipoprotein YifL
VRALLPLTLLALALAVGCGQKGPLVHPNKHPKTPVAADASGAAPAATPAPVPAAPVPSAPAPAAPGTPGPGGALPKDSSDSPAATPRG